MSVPLAASASRTLRSRLVTWLAVLVICAAAGGCVHRRMTIRSNPPGAQVYVDDYEIGTTPVSTNFTYYGTRRIRLVKDGYETLTVMQPVAAPWYQIPPLDFFSENCVPGELRDRHVFDYNLTPQLVVPTEQVLEQAERLRAQTRSSGAVQTGSALPAGPFAPAAQPAVSAPTSPANQPLAPPGGWR